jgi:hypothetical protein
MTRVVDKIIAFSSLHPLWTRLETAPSNGAAGSWSAPETAAKMAVGSAGDAPGWRLNHPFGIAILRVCLRPNRPERRACGALLFEFLNVTRRDSRAAGFVRNGAFADVDLGFGCCWLVVCGAICALTADGDQIW